MGVVARVVQEQTNISETWVSLHREFEMAFSEVFLK